MVTVGLTNVWEGKDVQVISERFGVEIIEHSDYIDLRVPELGSSSVVVVYKPERRFGKDLEKSRINWSACGSQDREITLRMTMALRIAVELAEACDKEVGL